MSTEEAKVVLLEHERFMRAEGEYYFSCVPLFTIEQVNEAKRVLKIDN